MSVIALTHRRISRHAPEATRESFDDARLNGITASTDGTMNYVTFTGPSNEQGGVLALPAF
jgi:hypothetical protein